MTSPYSFTDPDGDRMLVMGIDGEIAIHVYDGTGDACVKVTADRFPEILAAMYRAARLPVPFLLAPDEVGDGWVHVTGTRGAA